jgi:hypothetical protein
MRNARSGHSGETSRVSIAARRAAASGDLLERAGPQLGADGRTRRRTDHDIGVREIDAGLAQPVQHPGHPADPAAAPATEHKCLARHDAPAFPTPRLATIAAEIKSCARH